MHTADSPPPPRKARLRKASNSALLMKTDWRQLGNLPCQGETDRKQVGKWFPHGGNKERYWEQVCDSVTIQCRERY
jgi:hypothetical protein